MIWSLALAAVGVLGLYLSGKKNYWGWGIGLGAQVLWIAYAIVTQQWGFIISALAYAWVYGKNFLSWRKDAQPVPTPLPKARDMLEELLQHGCSRHKPYDGPSNLPREAKLAWLMDREGIREV